MKCDERVTMDAAAALETMREERGMMSKAERGGRVMVLDALTVRMRLS